MTTNGTKPPHVHPLRLLEHGGFFEIWDEAPMWTFEVEGSDAAYSMVYDGQPSARLSVELDGEKVRIDVSTGGVVEGSIAEDELAYALAIAGANETELSQWWTETHDRIESVKERLREMASGLTDPEDIEEEDH